MKLIIPLIIFLWCFTFHGNPVPDLKRNLDIDNINRGGCGYMALYISDYLLERGIDHEIVQFGNKKYPRIHIMVYVNQTYIDNNNSFGELPIFAAKLLGIKEKIITREQLREDIDNPLLWNKKFNRADTLKLKR